MWRARTAFPLVLSYIVFVASSYAILEVEKDLISNSVSQEVCCTVVSSEVSASVEKIVWKPVEALRLSKKDKLNHITNFSSYGHKSIANG